MAGDPYSVPPHAGTPRGRDGDARPAGPPGRAGVIAPGRGASARPALAVARRPAPARLTGAARGRLPPARQIHPDAAGRRRQRAAASGHVRPHGADPGSRQPAALHEHLVLETDDGWRVGFVDPRRFGSVDLVPHRAEDRHRLLAGLGPEPLDDGFTAARLTAALAGQAHADQGGPAGPEGRRRPGQHLCLRGAVPRPPVPAAARPHHPRRPGRPAGAGDQGRRCAEAIAAGGSSLRDYVQPDGELGYFQHAWKVYGREGEPCERCPGPPACPG